MGLSHLLPEPLLAVSGDCYCSPKIAKGQKVIVSFSDSVCLSFSPCLSPASVFISTPCHPSILKTNTWSWRERYPKRVIKSLGTAVPVAPAWLSGWGGGSAGIWERGRTHLSIHQLWAQPQANRQAGFTPTPPRCLVWEQLRPMQMVAPSLFH